MGCEQCTSGHGIHCKGPLGETDEERSCMCHCHYCPDCGSALCETMGGEQECFDYYVYFGADREEDDVFA